VPGIEFGIAQRRRVVIGRPEAGSPRARRGARAERGRRGGVQQPEYRPGRVQLVRVIAVEIASLHERPHRHRGIPGGERFSAVGRTQRQATRDSGFGSAPHDVGKPARRQERNGAISPNDQRPAVTLHAPGLRPDVISGEQRLCEANLKLVARAQGIDDREGELTHRPSLPSITTRRRRAGYAWQPARSSSGPRKRSRRRSRWAEIWLSPASRPPRSRSSAGTAGAR